MMWTKLQMHPNYCEPILIRGGQQGADIVRLMEQQYQRTDQVANVKRPFSVAMFGVEVVMFMDGCVWHSSTCEEHGCVQKWHLSASSLLSSVSLRGNTATRY
jgi:hypothetical protein